MRPMNVLVTGGSGRLGREVVRAGLLAGHRLRVASRRPRDRMAPASVEWGQVDLATGAGLDDALVGIDAVIHAASDLPNAVAVDVEGTRRLADVARGAGVGHVLYVSIVGVDRIPLPYYQSKLAAERVLAQAGVPYSILRATQFHDFIDFLFAAAARVPLVLPLPAGFHVQSVATEDVATRLLRALTDGPRGMLRNFAGPEPMMLAAAAAAWKAQRGVRKPTLRIPIPGKIAAAFRAGHNTVPDAERGTVTWQEWLVRQSPAAQAGRPVRG